MQGGSGKELPNEQEITPHFIGGGPLVPFEEGRLTGLSGGTSRGLERLLPGAIDSVGLEKDPLGFAVKLLSSDDWIRGVPKDDFSSETGNRSTLLNEKSCDNVCDGKRGDKGNAGKKFAETDLSASSDNEPIVSKFVKFESIVSAYDSIAWELVDVAVPTASMSGGFGTGSIGTKTEAGPIASRPMKVGRNLLLRREERFIGSSLLGVVKLNSSSEMRE